RQSADSFLILPFALRLLLFFSSSFSFCCRLPFSLSMACSYLLNFWFYNSRRPFVQSSPSTLIVAGSRRLQRMENLFFGRLRLRFGVAPRQIKPAFVFRCISAWIFADAIFDVLGAL